jgi:hypothetical protein
MQAVATKASAFENITQAPPDPILGVSEAFKADTSSDKLNLGVGKIRSLPPLCQCFRSGYPDLADSCWPGLGGKLFQNPSLTSVGQMRKFFKRLGLPSDRRLLMASASPNLA